MRRPQRIRGLLWRVLSVAMATGAMPFDSGSAFAELAEATENVRTEIAIPFFKLISYFVYAIGAVFIISGIAAAKKHSDAPMSQPLGPAIGRLFAGVAFLAAPSVIGMLQQTGFATLGSPFPGVKLIPF